MKKILAIDDQVENLITIKAVINSRIPNCEVLTAISGQDGINMAIKEQPDVILLDIIMPSMDGYETCKKLKENELCMHIPIVMVTAIKIDSESRVKGLNMGADAFLSKPIDAIELTAQVNVMLRIKEAEDKLRADKDLLEEVVFERTRDLHESESKMRSIYRVAPTGIGVLNDRVLIEVNPEICRMTGYSKEELSGNSSRMFYPSQEEFDLVGKEKYEQIAKNGSGTVETRWQKKDGQLISILLSSTPIDLNDLSKGITFTALDITERKQAENDLRQSYAHFKMLLDLAPDAFFHGDKNGNFIAANLSAIEMTGYSYDELMTMNMSDLFSELELKHQPLNYELLNKGKKIDATRELIKKDGCSVIIEMTSKKMADGTYQAFLRDITERKKAEEILLKLNIAINNAQEVFFMTDKKGIITYINPEFTKMYGYTAEEVIGKTTPRILKSGFFSDEQNEKIWKTILNKQSIPSVSYVNKRKDGTYIDIEGSIDHILDNQGDLMGYLGIQRDITERKQNEKAFRASEERLKIIFESAPDAYFLMDVKGTLLDGNNTAEELTNYKKEELIGENILKLSLLSAKELPKAVHSIAKSVMGKKTGPDEFLLNRKDGSKVPVEIISYPVKINNKTVILGIARDITERKRNDEEILKQRLRLAHILEGTNAGTWDWQVQTGSLELNNRWAEIMGYTLKELKPIDINTWINNVHPDDLPNANALLDKVFSKKLDYFDVEFRQPHKNGKWIWVNARGKVIEWAEDGKPLRMSGTHIDITERKRAEQIQDVIYNISEATNSSIAFSELIEIIRFELGKLIETTNLYIAFWDEKSGMLSSSSVKFDEKDKIVTWPAEKSATGYVIKRQKSLLASDEKIRKLAAAGEIEIIGTLSKVWLGVPLKADNKVIGAVVVQSYHNPNAYTEDDKLLLEFISNQIGTSLGRKKSEELLKKSEDRFNLAMKASNDGLYDWDLVTNEVYYSTRWKSMLGYEDNELPNDISIWDSLSHQEEKEKSLIQLQDAINNKTEHYNVEFRMKHKLGHWVNILSRAQIIYNDKGKAIRAVGTHSDLTEEKKAEQKLKNALKKAKESDRLKSAFLANMSHEIRTPMNGILGFADLLKQPDLSGDEQQSYIEVIERAGKRMLNIINDLINISRIEAGQVEIVFSEVNINKQTEYLYTFFKPEAEIKGLNLSFKNSLPDSKAIIQSDNEKIYAILANLIKNAIKYSPQGSIEFGYKLKGKFIEFFIKDAGIGIEKDKQKAIFDRFVQADLSLSSKYEGAGLGLAISKGYVEMLGGKIWVESAIGQGSLFSFTIPYRPFPDKASKGKEEDPKSIIDTFNKKINILIAEDDETSNLYLSTIIKSICKEVVHAKTGIETIEICKKKVDIDLVFMDIKMPEMDGYEATRKIREFNKDVIIIAQTAYALQGDREKALEAGCNDYIKKPISKKNLFEIIGKHFEK